jgi:hypothetical protein
MDPIWNDFQLERREMPREIAQVLIRWVDANRRPKVDLRAARVELVQLLAERAPNIGFVETVLTANDLKARYPLLAQIAEKILLSPTSELGRKLQKISDDYEAHGGQLLSAEEIERELQERRGAA